MSFLKIFTTRNAFSREYGTWLIVLFNFALVPILLHNLTLNIVLYFLSVVFFLMFRFELLDFFSINVQFSKKNKIIQSIIYLSFSVGLFLFLVITQFINLKVAVFLSVSGALMITLNIITRRKKGKRQNIFAQITLVCFIAFLGALNYYFLTGFMDNNLLYIFLFSALFYTNSIIYVRSKTVGLHYDSIALAFSIFIVLFAVILSIMGLINKTMIIIFIPTLIKNLDNVLLYNLKVPLRRIGINETIHCIIFIFMYYLVY